MNRLQKKCLISTVGIHLLLLTILIVGPAFFNQEPKMDNLEVLNVIPAVLVDAAVNSGVANAQPPPPTPVVTPPVQPLQPIPLPPKIVQPPVPAPPPTPSPSLLKEFEDFLKSKPEPAVKPDLTPVEHETKSQPQNNIKVDLHKVARAKVENVSHTDNAVNARAINNAIRSLSHQLSSSTKIDMPGNASASYASYASVVKSVYDRAILPNVPGAISGNNENTRVIITIASDGTVTSSRIISPSGDPAWDDAVQRTLDQVNFVAPFPDGATDKERHYTIDFNPQVERELQ